jgi:hypothetical protein
MIVPEQNLTTAGTKDTYQAGATKQKKKEENEYPSAKSTKTAKYVFWENSSQIYTDYRNKSISISGIFLQGLRRIFLCF